VKESRFTLCLDWRCKLLRPHRRRNLHARGNVQNSRLTARARSWDRLPDYPGGVPPFTTIWSFRQVFLACPDGANAGEAETLALGTDGNFFGTTISGRSRGRSRNLQNHARRCLCPVDSRPCRCWRRFRTKLGLLFNQDFVSVVQSVLPPMFPRRPRGCPASWAYNETETTARSHTIASRSRAAKLFLPCRLPACS